MKELSGSFLRSIAFLCLYINMLFLLKLKTIMTKLKMSTLGATTWLILNLLWCFSLWKKINSSGVMNKQPNMSPIHQVNQVKLKAVISIC